MWYEASPSALLPSLYPYVTEHNTWLDYFWDKWLVKETLENLVPILMSYASDNYFSWQS